MSDTDFPGMLAAAEAGDSGARMVMAYSFLNGQYRDGTNVDKDYNLAYAWASLANYQGHESAQNLLNIIIPKLDNRDYADKLASEFYAAYGAEKNSASKH